MKEMENKLEEIEEALELTIHRMEKIEQREIKLPDHNPELKNIRLSLQHLNNSQKQECKNLSEEIGSLMVTVQKQREIKNIKREFRFLLFPEINQEKYYRIVFGRLIPWALAFTTIIFLFFIVKISIENWKYRVHDREVTTRIKAWTYLREYGGKTVNKEMDKALESAKKVD